MSVNLSTQKKCTVVKRNREPSSIEQFRTVELNTTFPDYTIVRLNIQNLARRSNLTVNTDRGYNRRAGQARRQQLRFGAKLCLE